jgi:pimeloyl-ACP methyl ester carboxylesterase
VIEGFVVLNLLRAVRGKPLLSMEIGGENSDSWDPLAADLMKNQSVVVPDLWGIGLSLNPAGGYDKKTQAKDIRVVVTALGYDRTVFVAHDIGNMVANAYAAI